MKKLAQGSAIWQGRRDERTDSAVFWWQVFPGRSGFHQEDDLVPHRIESEDAEEPVCVHPSPSEASMGGLGTRRGQGKIFRTLKVSLGEDSAKFNSLGRGPASR